MGIQVVAREGSDHLDVYVHLYTDPLTRPHLWPLLCHRCLGHMPGSKLAAFSPGAKYLLRASSAELQSMGACTTADATVCRFRHISRHLLAQTTYCLMCVANTVIQKMHSLPQSSNLG